MKHSIGALLFFDFFLWHCSGCTASLDLRLPFDEHNTSLPFVLAHPCLAVMCHCRRESDVGLRSVPYGYGTSDMEDWSGGTVFSVTGVRALGQGQERFSL